MADAYEIPPYDPERSSDNTPPPGGGRWIWDEETNYWAPAPDLE